MGGYKTICAGVGGILAGLAVIVKAIAADAISFNEIGEGVLIVVGGLGILGIGGKIQKLIDK